MKINAYAIYDRKALIYNLPFFAVNHPTALRVVEGAVVDPNTSLHRNASDFVLFHVGSYDDASGEIVPENPLRHVADVQTLMNRPDPHFEDRTYENEVNFNKVA